MAVTVGTLAVELEAKTKEFRTAIKDAERRLDDFSDEAEKDSKAATKGFSGIAKGVAAVGAALAALGAVRVLGQIATNAIQGAAAFEQYEVRLKGLLGSQEAANRSLQTFTELSTKTPFAVGQIVEGAATLASAAGGSREELELLTQTSANLAAVTGLSFADASGNLQRALSAGIGAADLFRDRGVRALIESVQMIPDLTKVPLAAQRQAFIDTFGPDALTPFATAAEDLSNTLGGALSNIGDASDNASRALGEAFAPSTFAAAKAVVIPFFQTLEKNIKANEDAISDFVVQGIQNLLRGFAFILDAGGQILGFLSAFRIDFSDLGDVVTIVRSLFVGFFSAVKVGIDTIVAGVSLLADGVGVVGNALGLISDENAALLRTFRENSIDDLVDSADNLGNELEESLFQAAIGLENLADDGDDFAVSVLGAADQIRGTADAVGDLRDQFTEMRNEQKAATDEATSEAARRAKEIAQLVGGFEEDPEFRQAQLESLIEEDRKLAAASLKKGSVAVEESIGEAVQAGIRRGFADLLGAGGQNFANQLADLSGKAFRDSLEDVFEDLANFFGDSLEDVFKSLDLEGLFGGGVGGGFGTALGAGLGIIGALVADQIAGSESTTRIFGVQSAVASTQAVRGIVAGPANIPIAQVGNAIRDATAAQVGEIRRGNGILESILGAIRGLEPGSFASGDELAAAISREFTGSPALG